MAISVTDGPSYAAALLEVITADEDAKGPLLDAIPSPQANWTWELPSLPKRPGRSPAIHEGSPPRRRRGLGNPLSRAQFLHAIWHIEVSAIDLAVLCSLAGSGMSVVFHAEQLRVAREEFIHSQLMADLLQTYGKAPGIFPVHHRLWDSALACDNLGEHLVVIPRFLEARGLDVNAEMLDRVAEIDQKAHAVLHRIYLDEIGHVRTGTRWHHEWCAQRALNPQQHFADVLNKQGLLRFPNPAPLDYEGRQQAGFHADEIALLEPKPKMK